MENEKMASNWINLEGKIMGYDKKALLVTALVIGVAFVFFYTGAKYEKHKLSNMGLLIDKEDKLNSPSIKGILIAKDEKSITIKMDDGSLKIIPFGEKTTFGSNSKDTSADLIVGQLLVVTGENNPDGTFIPQNIRKSKKSPKITNPVPANSVAPPPATVPIK